MERLSVDDMKAIELDIMDEIDRVCAAHGVEYFLGYGTLLGAVRHGGFIPWDDDMDIVMMRDQYELLMAHVRALQACVLSRQIVDLPVREDRRHDHDHL